MKKFVYYFEPNGKNFYLKAHSLKEAKTKLKKSLGGVPYFVGETNFRTARQPKSQAEFEVSLLK